MIWPWNADKEWSRHRDLLYGIEFQLGMDNFKKRCKESDFSPSTLKSVELILEKFCMRETGKNRFVIGGELSWLIVVSNSTHFLKEFEMLAPMAFAYNFLYTVRQIAFTDLPLVFNDRQYSDEDKKKILHAPFLLVRQVTEFMDTLTRRELSDCLLKILETRLESKPALFTMHLDVKKLSIDKFFSYIEEVFGKKVRNHMYENAEVVMFHKELNPPPMTYVEV